MNILQVKTGRTYAGLTGNDVRTWNIIKSGICDHEIYIEIQCGTVAGGDLGNRNACGSAFAPRFDVQVFPPDGQSIHQ